MATPLRPGQLTVIALAGTTAVLMVVIAWETGWGEGLHARLPVKSLPAGAPVEPKLLPQLVASAPEQAWPETAARPIFVPGRRPAPTLIPPSAMRKGQFILQGTTVVGPLSIAMLKEISTGKLHRLEKGREIFGMTLAEVARDQVTLRSGDDSETLLLMVSKAAGGPAAPQQAFVQTGPFTSSAPVPGNPAQSAASPAPQQGAPGVPGPGVPGPGGGPQPTAMAPPVPSGSAPASTMAGPAPVATPESVATTPEEILARRRAARRSQQTN